MHKNSEVFLATFNKIDKELGVLMNHTTNMGFSKSVKILQKYNAVVKRYSDDLLEFAELRNAIVHNKVDVSYAIAEPHDSVIERISNIENELSTPKRADRFFRRKVFCLQQGEPIARALALIHEKGFSKIPIYHGQKFTGLLTQKGITKWISKSACSGEIAIEDIVIEDVLPFEKQTNCTFIAGDTSVYEAVDVFKEKMVEGNRLEALLITENGNVKEKLTGIITNTDIMKIE